MSHSFAPSRRLFLRYSTNVAVAGASLPFTSRAFAGPPRTRSLALDHTHTHEKVSLAYARGNRYFPEALGRLNRFLRDHYTGDVGTIDPQLFDILHRITLALSTQGAYQVISGYRCPATNNRLRTTRGGGVAKRSLHMDGKAIDVRLPGVPLAELRDAALSLQAGGVGFYPQDQFVHIDTGRVRSW